MTAELFILGLLARLGPQHGYTLRKAIQQQAADFAGIKLPTVYYHLGRLEKEGRVRSRGETVGNRPERTVYELTPAGHAALSLAVHDAMADEFLPRFPIDAALFFGELAQPGDLVAALRERLRATQERLQHIEAHRQETLAGLQGRSRIAAEAIFDHHSAHYSSECRWIERTCEALGAPAPRTVQPSGARGRKVRSHSRSTS